MYRNGPLVYKIDPDWLKEPDSLAQKKFSDLVVGDKGLASDERIPRVGEEMNEW